MLTTLLGPLLGAAAGYLIGSVPSAALVAKLKRQDIFAVGSSSMGAMNTARHLGWALGALVLALDLAKGALATAAGLWLSAGMNASSSAALWTPLAAGSGAVAGHLWSVWVGFRGGKGLATALGVSLPLYALGGLYGLLTLLALLALLRRVTLATLLTALGYPLLVYLSLVQTGTPNRVVPITLGVSVVALLVALKHALPVAGPRRQP
jgi:acyl phosphate:glycerol-3-phosphate acyltransferase